MDKKFNLNRAELEERLKCFAEDINNNDNWNEQFSIINKEGEEEYFEIFVKVSKELVKWDDKEWTEKYKYAGVYSMKVGSNFKQEHFMVFDDYDEKDIYNHFKMFFDNYFAE